MSAADDTRFNAQPDWPPLEVVSDFMRDRALQILAAFPWARAQARTTVGETA